MSTGNKILDALLAGSAGQSQLGGGAIAGQQLGGSPALQAPPSGTPAWSPQAPAQDPLATLLQGSMRYQQQHGEDPLGAAAGRGALGTSGGAFGSRPPVSQVTDGQAQGLNRVAQVTSHGPREGQAHTTFDIGNGLKANVYYDAKGRRKTFVYHA